MSWYSRTWTSCGHPYCDAEALRTKAVQQGWLICEGERSYCPLHRPDRRVTSGPDAAERAAGEAVHRGDQ